MDDVEESEDDEEEEDDEEPLDEQEHADILCNTVIVTVAFVVVTMPRIS